jgi:glycosyltransferase involved in cell wall biosynthesis
MGIKHKNVYIVCANITLPGGTERAIANTVDLLNDSGDINLNIVSLCSHSGHPAYYDVNAPIIHCGLPDMATGALAKFKWYINAVKVLKAIFSKEKDVDVILSYGHNVSVMIPWISPESARLYACEHINFHSIPKINRILMGLMYRRLNGIVVLSETARKKMAHLHDQIYVIPNTLSFPPVTSISAAMPKKIIMVGRISAEKGYDRVVPIAESLRKIWPDWRIEIFGAGPDMEKIKKEYTKAGISDYVILKGATKDVESEYKKASLLIMTSYTEALPMVVIEAKACGVPAIAYECEGTRELINDSHDGYIIRNDDHEEFAAKITALINDKEKYMEFANNALKESEKFSDSRILELWRNLIIVC